jgi:hypothetical protein
MFAVRVKVFNIVEDMPAAGGTDQFDVPFVLIVLVVSSSSSP